MAFLRITVLSVAAWIGSAIAIYHVAVWLAPPRTDGHPVMPLGQVLLAGLGATIIAIALIVVQVSRHRRRSRARASFASFLSAPEQAPRPGPR